MDIINSIKFEDKMYKHFRLRKCDSLMYETVDKTLRITIASSKEIHMLLEIYYESNFDKSVSNIKQSWPP